MSSQISKRTKAQPLTLELLKQHVPIVKAGANARTRLKEEETNPTATPTQKKELLKQKLEGTKSQEILIISALPLIKNIASKEFQRRKAWLSRIQYDDILSEGIAGFIRGLLSYNENANHSSPVNYLGQWVTTGIRRQIENQEHDFTIPYDTVERSRRIRAVRSRMTSENGVKPTNEELLKELNDPADPTKYNRWAGKKPSTEDLTNEENTTKTSTPKKNKFTINHIHEADAMNDRFYSIGSNEQTFANEDDDTYERQSTSLTSPDKHDNDIDIYNINNSRYTFFETVFVNMQIGSRQKDIILRYFGMKPYTEPQTQKIIIQETAMPSRFVKTVINSFSTYMPTKGGVFHKLILETDIDIIESIELTWLIPILGEWPKIKTPVEPPIILQQTNYKIPK